MDTARAHVKMAARDVTPETAPFWIWNGRTSNEGTSGEDVTLSERGKNRRDLEWFIVNLSVFLVVDGDFFSIMVFKK